MPDPTLPLLMSFVEHLTQLGVKKEDQHLPLLYAKIFLRRATEADGRLNLEQLQSTCIQELIDSFATCREVFHALSLNQVLVDDKLTISIPHE